MVKEKKVCPTCGEEHTKDGDFCGRACYWLARTGKSARQNGKVEIPPVLNAVAEEWPNVQVKLEDFDSRLAEVEGVTPPRVIHVRQPDGADHEVTGAVHEAFERILQMAMARKPIFLPGPSGSGKTHVSKQVSEALNLRFGSVSCSVGMSESQLLGRSLPTGKNGEFEFQTTEFLECYEKGGVFLLDEMDAADSNVLIALNSAIANGEVAVPARKDKPRAVMHEDFVIIAAANTFGRGADRLYCGRNQLDEATLDRFRIGTIPMDYNAALEKQLCPITELYSRLKGYRDRIAANRLQRIVSTRFMKDAYEMVSKWGWTYEMVDEQLFSGWREDEIAKVKSN